MKMLNGRGIFIVCARVCVWACLHFSGFPPNIIQLVECETAYSGFMIIVHLCVLEV